MSQISKQTIRNWNALTSAEQRSLAEKVARSRSREFREKYPNVMSCGAGYRLRRAQLDAGREVCLKFTVKRKWTRPSAKGVPPFVAALHRDKRTKKAAMVAVPTDVDELADGEPSVGNDLKDGVIARSSVGGTGELGAVCCLVRDKADPARLFLLGCHHVFTRSLRRRWCEPDQTSVLFRRDDGHTRIGNLAYFTNLAASPYFAMDLAAVEVTNLSRVSSFIHGREPTRVARRAETPINYEILSPRGRLPALFVAKLYDHPLTFPCGSTTRTLRFGAVYQSQAVTLGGDSGSPLVGTTGTLYGMHFYRYARTSLAIPAYEIFSELNFNMKMALVTGHDP